MENKVENQILQIRETGLTNMLDLKNVKFIAKELNLVELTNFLKERENINKYVNFILKGKGID